MKEHLFKNKIYYQTNEFKGGRPTLVFIHGLGGSSSAWIPYQRRFENEYNILTFDLRGHGKSIRLTQYEDYEIKKFVYDIHDLISYLQISKHILVGHSLGTLIVLEYLACFQKEVAAVVMLSPNFQIGKNVLEKVAHGFIKLSKIFNYLPSNANKRGHVNYSRHLNTGDWNLPRMFADIRNTTPRVYFYCVRQIHGFNKEDMLEKINMPCLIIHGKKDTIFSSEIAVFMNKKIKNSELLILPNTDHIIALNNVSEICSAVESFVENNKITTLFS